MGLMKMLNEEFSFDVMADNSLIDNTVHGRFPATANEMKNFKQYEEKIEINERKQNDANHAINTN